MSYKVSRLISNFDPCLTCYCLPSDESEGVRPEKKELKPQKVCIRHYNIALHCTWSPPMADVQDERVSSQMGGEVLLEEFMGFRNTGTSIPAASSCQLVYSVVISFISWTSISPSLCVPTHAKGTWTCLHRANCLRTSRGGTSGAAPPPTWTRRWRRQS